jgi:predicted RNase H-like HicB family nuclease
MRALASAATLAPDREAGRFAVTFPDPPGVISQGEGRLDPLVQAVSVALPVSSVSSVVK